MASDNRREIDAIRRKRTPNRRAKRTWENNDGSMNIDATEGWTLKKIRVTINRAERLVEFLVNDKTGEHIVIEPAQLWLPTVPWKAVEERSAPPPQAHHRHD